MTVSRAGKLGRVIVAITLLVAVTSVLRAAQTAPAAKIDLTGTWIFNVETDAGSGTPTVTLKQEAEKVTGHYSSATLGEADLTGTLKGQALEFKFMAPDIGPVTYTGTAESSNAIKGTLDIAGMVSGTFTAKRKE
jgi:hypothetical protein